MRERTHLCLPPLTEEQIEIWVTSHQAATGKMPSRDSGPIPKSGGETWCGVVIALRKAGRGLNQRTTLKKLMAAHC